MSPHDESSLMKIAIGQARMESKLDSLLDSMNRHSVDIAELYKRTNQHNSDISHLKAKSVHLQTQQDYTVSRGFAVVTILLSSSAVLITLIFNLM